MNTTSNQPAVYKAQGVKQRIDVTLSREIVIALTNLISEGKSTYPKAGFIHTHAKDGKVINVPTSLVNSWVSRRNVIPETGELLREVLDKARARRKEMVSAMMRDRILETAQRGLEAVLSLPNNLGAKTVSRQFKRTKEGEVVEAGKSIMDRGINTQLVAIKARTAQFALERLDPDFARKDKVEGKHLVFNLADLRRVSEQNTKQIRHLPLNDSRL